MERIVKQIGVVSDPGTPYFLEVFWEKGLEFGFSVTLCNGQLAWSGYVSKEDVSKDAADMKMEKGKYVTELRNTLCLGAEQTVKYTFDFCKEDGEDDCICFSYEKSIRDVVFRLGSLILRRVLNPIGVITDLISYCLSCSAELRARNEQLRKENERLLTDWNHMQGQLEAFVYFKEELEKDLYTRFTLVLNEKKAKIRSLLEKLKDVEDRLETRQAEEAIPDIRSMEKYYDGSTEEDSNSHTTKNTEETATFPRRYSLRSITDDSPEVPPTRNRRERAQKSSVKEQRPLTKEPAVQEKQKPEPAPSKKGGRRPSTRRSSLKTAKEAEDPDDLFNAM